MEIVKFSVVYYMGIGEAPLAILLDQPKGIYKRQFDTIEELKKSIGEDVFIYFVADKTDKRIDGLDNWGGGKFNFDKLAEYINNLITQ